MVAVATIPPVPSLPLVFRSLLPPSTFVAVMRVSLFFLSGLSSPLLDGLLTLPVDDTGAVGRGGGEAPSLASITFGKKKEQEKNLSKKQDCI